MSNQGGNKVNKGNQNIGAFAQAVDQFGIGDFTQAVSHLFRERSFEWQEQEAFQGNTFDFIVKTEPQLVGSQGTILQGPASVSVNLDDDPSNGDGYDTDFLGVYRSQKKSADIGYIILFDKPITRVAIDLDCDANALAGVVLFHELAHMAVHAIKGEQFSDQPMNYHEQWAQCLAYWAMSDDQRKIFEVLEKNQSPDYQLSEEGLKQFLCEDDSAEHVYLINMLLEGLPHKGEAVGRKEDSKVRKVEAVKEASSSVIKL